MKISEGVAAKLSSQMGRTIFLLAKYSARDEYFTNNVSLVCKIRSNVQKCSIPTSYIIELGNIISPIQYYQFIRLTFD